MLPKVSKDALSRSAQILASRAVCRPCRRSATNYVDELLLERPKKKSPYPLGQHRSNAETMINQVAPIEVDGRLAVCDGGGGALGHPIEYIQLDNIAEGPSICKYCGLRYISRHH